MTKLEITRRAALLGLTAAALVRPASAEPLPTVPPGSFRGEVFDAYVWLCHDADGEQPITNRLRAAMGRTYYPDQVETRNLTDLVFGPFTGLREPVLITHIALARTMTEVATISGLLDAPVYVSNDDSVKIGTGNLTHWM